MNGNELGRAVMPYFYHKMATKNVAITRLWGQEEKGQHVKYLFGFVIKVRGRDVSTPQLGLSYFTPQV